MAEDLASLDSIDSTNVLKTLEARFNERSIYTKNGSVLIAINPYQEVPLYDQARLERYKSSMAIDKEAPHIFAVAGAAHRNMISSGMNQAIVISGESGAGKTETARFVLQYLRTVSNATDDLEKRIHGSQPITEAFGCAKTLRNDNSSRFGKFLMLNFNQSAKIQVLAAAQPPPPTHIRPYPVTLPRIPPPNLPHRASPRPPHTLAAPVVAAQGAKMSTYLLEKSRITHVGEGASPCPRPPCIRHQPLSASFPRLHYPRRRVPALSPLLSARRQ